MVLRYVSPSCAAMAYAAAGMCLSTVHAHVLPRQTRSESSSSPSNELPLTPVITPALGLAGVILMITGVLYAVIGIKYRLLHVFMSMAYLISLSVTVLIEYALDPPVSNAVQGALFVAACISGAIVGAVALIFKDMTEGLGCLLGGFCFSMWLMTLRSGGLIHSRPGTVSLILILSASSFALFFVRRIKDYALGASISFSGATAVMIGIDCFTRAGLKEFWIYIWGVNNKTFPLGSNFTYPITKGIRIEVGCIVILFGSSLAYQIKLWKAGKQYHQTTSAERLHHRGESEMKEETQSRHNQEMTVREQALWEAAYDDIEARRLSKPDAGLTSSMPHYLNSTASIAATDPGNSILDKIGSAPTATFIEESEEEPNHTDRSVSADSIRRLLKRPNIQESATSEDRSVETNATRDGYRSLSLQTEYPSLSATSRPPPPVFHLPFQVGEQAPNIDGMKRGEEDMDCSHSSLVGSVDHFSNFEMRGMLEEEVTSWSSNQPLDDYNRDDLTDSDENRGNEGYDDLGEIELPQDFDEEELEDPRVGESRVKQLEPEEESLSLTDTDHQQIQGRKAVVSTKSDLDHTYPKAEENDSQDFEDAQKNNSCAQPRVQPQVQITATKTDPVRQSLDSSLLGAVSKVATSYRTNEWAKYLGEADPPELEQDLPQRPESPGVRVTYRGMGPSTSSSMIEADLRWTDFDHANDIQAPEPSPKDKQRPQNQSLALSPRQDIEPPAVPNPCTAQTLPKTRGAPTPINSALALDNAHLHKRVASLPPINTTLLGQRQAILNSRFPSTSSTPGTSTPVSYTARVSLDSPDAEDIPLSQRRTLLLQSQSRSPTQQSHLRTSSLPQNISTASSRRYNSNTTFQTPQTTLPGYCSTSDPQNRHSNTLVTSSPLSSTPSLDTAARQRHLRQTWQAHPSVIPETPQFDEGRRGIMLQELKETQASKRERLAREVQDKVSERMRTSVEMWDLHREKMSGLQREVGRRTGIL